MKTTEYAFTIELAHFTDLTDALESAVCEAGCDDALLWSRDGKVFLDLTRAGVSAYDAVNSAPADLQRIGLPGPSIATASDGICITGMLPSAAPKEPA